MSPVVKKRKTALVLSGGGSRGAYEAGVILYLRQRLPELIGRELDLDIITGTSVGAINAAYLAATADTPRIQGEGLCDAWRSLRIENLLGLGKGDFWRASKLLWGGKSEPPKPGTYRLGGLIETDGLENFVIQTIPWRGIRRNLLAGKLDSLAISATHIGTGHSVVFIDSKEKLTGKWNDDAFTRHLRVPIGPRHALASAAIPVLFPAVKVGGSFYLDGGLRQNTPMSPAIRLGADRMIVVTLRFKALEEVAAERVAAREAAVAKPLFLLGKSLSALMLDHTETDLLRLRRLNAIVEAGRKAYGEDFDDVISGELKKMGRGDLRHIETVHIQPSSDIAQMASRFVDSGRVTLKGRLAKRLFARLAKREADKETDLLSYFLFDGNFANELIELGYRDAMSMEDELVAMLKED